MKVDKAIEFLEKVIMPTFREFRKSDTWHNLNCKDYKVNDIIDLLKSLEAENKAHQKRWKKFVDESLEYHRGRKVYINANIELKKENKARMAMWEEFKNYIQKDVSYNTYDYENLICSEHYIEKLKEIEQEYLGGQNE